MTLEMNQQTVMTIVVTIVIMYALMYLMGCPCCSHISMFTQVASTPVGYFQAPATYEYGRTRDYLGRDWNPRVSGAVPPVPRIAKL